MVFSKWSSFWVMKAERNRMQDCCLLLAEPGNQCSNISLVIGTSAMLPKHKAEMEWYMCAVLSVSNFCLWNPSIQKCEYSIFNKKPPAESTVSNVKQVKDCYLQSTRDTNTADLKIMTEKPDVASNTESSTEVILLLNKLILHKNNALMSLLPF